MKTAIITGSSGLIGSEAVRHFAAEGFDVIGIDNDMRAEFFGAAASTQHVTAELTAELPDFRALQTLTSGMKTRSTASLPSMRPSSN